MLAVLICSRDYSGAGDLLADPDLEKDLVAWEKKIRGRIFRRRKAAARIASAGAIFNSYVRNGMAFTPEVAAKSSQDGTIIRSEWSMLSVASSMKVFGQTFEEAINQYAPLARWLLVVNGEREGVVSLYEPGELESLQAEADAIAAEVEAQEKAAQVKGTN